MAGTSFSPNQQRKGAALCLSGGGFRAALFHLGSLRRLNEAGVLAKITTITSVSGGSIASGLLAKMWRSFQIRNDVIQNLNEYETALRDFCSHDLRTAPLLWERLDPRNWPTVFSEDHSVTDFLAQAYEDRLVKGLRLSDLPVKGVPGEPKFIFCASSMQTGVDFELSGERIGDYQIGYASAPEIPLSDAIAASSAFPIAFPPLILKMDRLGSPAESSTTRLSRFNWPGASSCRTAAYMTILGSSLSGKPTRPCCVRTEASPSALTRTPDNRWYRAYCGRRRL